MKAIKSLGRKLKVIVQKEQGGALVIALIIMLALTLLGLSLLLQSNTEYVISLNERDSTAALYNAEAALQLAKQRLRIYGANLTDALDGPDPAITNDNGVISILNPSLTDPAQLNATCPSATCEQTESAIVTLPDGNIYEAFRIGVDNGSDDIWDGPRGLLFVRIEDNYDDKPALNNKWVDTDRRVTAHVISQYPIQVDAAGTVIGTGLSKMHTLRAAGISTRQLIARFGTSETRAAIVSKKDMELQGSLHVCGACGSVHANQDLEIEGDPGFHICENATETNNDPVVTGGTIDGTVGNSGPITVPVANPFHEDYTPKVEWFNTLGDPELGSFPDLQCPPFHSTTNPGGSKYFALVGDGGDGLVYKAYWNPSTTPPRWTWKLIDDLNDNKDTALDACGRVVSGEVNGVALIADAGATIAEPIDDAENAQHKSFYGFDYKAGSGLNACDENDDGTLGPTSTENNFVDNDYFLTLPSIPLNAILPGTFRDPAGPESNDDYEAGEWYGKGDRLWRSNANDVYAPVYNAVIFVSGNLTLSGGLNNLCTFDGCLALPPAPSGVWRVTFVALGNINAGGGPRYAPVRSFDIIPNNQYLMVAGRDIELSGTPGEGDICPANCDDPPANLAGYAGIVLAHEQIKLTGNVSVNGIIQAEDEAQCANLVSGEGIQASSSVEVYYDCEHPPNTGAETATMTAWEEVQ